MSETYLTESQPYCNTGSLFSLSSIPNLQIIVPEDITLSSHSSLQLAIHILKVKSTKKKIV